MKRFAPHKIDHDAGTDSDADAINVFVMMKDSTKERYIILCGEGRHDQALRTIGRWAANPDLSFSWWDAAVLSREIREAVKP